MSLSAFDDPDEKPSDGALRRRLGAAAPLWNELVAHVDETYPSVTQQWSFGGAKYGWSLRLKRGERVILYLIPQPKHFLVGIVLGAAAVAAAKNADLPRPVQKAIAEAPRYAEGTGLRLPVHDPEALSAVMKLTAMKMAATPRRRVAN